MATVYGTNYSKTLTAYDPDTYMPFSAVNNEYHNNLLMVFDSYTTGEDGLEAGSTIYLGKIPAGYKPLFFVWTSEAQGQAVTGTVYVGNVAATAAKALTDMTSATAQVVPALPAVSTVSLTETSDVTVVTADEDMAAGTTVTLLTVYIKGS